MWKEGSQVPMYWMLLVATLLIFLYLFVSMKIWRTEQGPRVAAFKVGKDCRYEGMSDNKKGKVEERTEMDVEKQMNEQKMKNKVYLLYASLVRQVTVCWPWYTRTSTRTSAGTISSTTHSELYTDPWGRHTQDILCTIPHSTQVGQYTILCIYWFTYYWETYGTNLQHIKGMTCHNNEKKLLIVFQ